MGRRRGQLGGGILTSVRAEGGHELQSARRALWSHLCHSWCRVPSQSSRAGASSTALLEPRSSMCGALCCHCLFLQRPRLWGARQCALD